jgi:transcriptional regulator with XRE-family HTH domain
MISPKPNPARDRHWVCAQRLRERRLALGLTQLEVVARLQQRGAYTTNRTLSAMENGRGLDLGMLPELAGSLDCTVTYLLGMTTDPSRWVPGDAAPPERAVERAPTVNGIGILGPDVPAAFSTRRRR